MSVMPNSRFVAGDVKYLAIAAFITAAHIVAMPLVVVVLVEFSSFLTRKLVNAVRKVHATRRA